MITIKWNMFQMVKSQGGSHFGEKKPGFSLEPVRFEMLSVTQAWRGSKHLECPQLCIRIPHTKDPELVLEELMHQL